MTNQTAQTLQATIDAYEELKSAIGKELPHKLEWYYPDEEDITSMYVSDDTVFVTGSTWSSSSQDNEWWSIAIPLADIIRHLSKEEDE